MAQPPRPSSPPLSSKESIVMGTPSPPPMSLNETTAMAGAVGATINPQQVLSSVSESTPAAVAAGPFLSDPFDRRTHVASSNIGLLTPPLNSDTAKQPPLTATTATSTYTTADVVHDVYNCMFKVGLDTEGATAALCYLPTRFQSMIEFYHTEIPVEYRSLGVGELLLIQGFLWAETSQLLVIPSCPFVRRYLDRNQDRWDCVVLSEIDGVSRLIARAK